ncbi:MAG: ATP-binding protein [Saprospiraceae bacterium]|nr:MAG: ATP-binding protein [Saprospiraceae bacterium]
MNHHEKFTNLPKRNAEPKAAAMIESFRAIGYSPETALADLIDNSISAGAKNVRIEFIWAGRNSWLTIIDDGWGMAEDEIIDALRPGSKDPDHIRLPSDLGRFGLGLKTASFSQCGRLTVISKKAGSPASHWTWDLDFVRQSGKWEVFQDEIHTNFYEKIPETGTIVLWENMDRLAGNADEEDEESHQNFLKIGESFRKHLEMVFHRYIESGKINLLFNGRKISAWNPFMPGKLPTQVFSEEPLQNGAVILKGYVLPHKSKISEEEYKAGEGPKGWNAQQGFYIYRNERLLVAGDWLGMFRIEEHYKLARIMVDISNLLDKDWQLDIKKSVAKPPHGVVTAIKNYALKVRNQAVEVYRHKGRTIHRNLANEEFKQVWFERKRHGKYHYVINREHPLVKNILDTMPDMRKHLGILLNLIEETVPIPLMIVREREEPESQGRPFESIDHSLLKQLMQMSYDKFISEGKSGERAKELLLLIEPFNQYPEYLEHLTM